MADSKKEVMRITLDDIRRNEVTSDSDSVQPILVQPITQEVLPQIGQDLKTYDATREVPEINKKARDANGGIVSQMVIGLIFVAVLYCLFPDWCKRNAKFFHKKATKIWYILIRSAVEVPKKSNSSTPWLRP